MPRSSERHLALVPPSVPPLGSALAALYDDPEFDWFDRHMRQHAEPEFRSAVERDLENARRLLFGDVA